MLRASAELFPSPAQTWVHPARLRRRWEGRWRACLMPSYSHLKGAGIYKQSRMYKTLGDAWSAVEFGHYAWHTDREEHEEHALTTHRCDGLSRGLGRNHCGCWSWTCVTELHQASARSIQPEWRGERKPARYRHRGQPRSGTWSRDAETHRGFKRTQFEMIFKFLWVFMTCMCF